MDPALFYHVRFNGQYALCIPWSTQVTLTETTLTAWAAACEHVERARDPNLPKMPVLVRIPWAVMESNKDKLLGPLRQIKVEKIYQATYNDGTLHSPAVRAQYRPLFREMMRKEEERAEKSAGHGTQHVDEAKLHIASTPKMAFAESEAASGIEDGAEKLTSGASLETDLKEIELDDDYEKLEDNDESFLKEDDEWDHLDEYHEKAFDFEPDDEEHDDEETDDEETDDKVPDLV